MPQELSNVLIYILICVNLFIIGFLGIWLKRKYNVSKKEMEMLKTIFNTIDYIVSKTNIRYKGQIATVIKYCLQAIDFVNQYSDEYTTPSERKQLIIDKALEICEENGITIDKELIDLIDELVDYFIKEQK